MDLKELELLDPLDASIQALKDHKALKDWQALKALRELKD
jgi:hypothetical protein